MKNNIELHSDFNKYIKVFLNENRKHNLISKNDEEFLYEKHIYDSLGIKLFFEKYGANYRTLLDIGCGGGFPCVPIAIEYPNISVTGIDSIRKKIDSISNIKNELGLNNLKLICDRAENIKDVKFDIIVSRAVAELSKLLEYAIPLLNDNGYFISYKSKKADEEISRAEKTLSRFGAKVVDIIDYTLPLNEVYERKLICIKKS